MHALTAWAYRHAIPAAALADLLQTLGAAIPPDAPPAAARSEAAVQQAVRLEAARRGVILWRNNVGMTQDESGRVVRYGLANSSAGENKVFKSSDLIGIGPDGKFWALECKRPGWHLTPGDARGNAQLAFLNFVLSRGGVAKFVTDPQNF
jgi:hypothetical protein